MDTLTSRLRWCLDHSGITRKLLASASGLKRETVTAIANGARGDKPRIVTTEALARALAVPFDWLAIGAGQPPSEEALRAREVELRALYPDPDDDPEVDTSEEYAQPDAAEVA